MTLFCRSECISEVCFLSAVRVFRLGRESFASVQLFAGFVSLHIHHKTSTRTYCNLSKDLLQCTVTENGHHDPGLKEAGVSDRDSTIE